MIKRDIVIVDHINMISQTKVDPRMMENFSIKMTNVRKYRVRIERRKQKIKRLYE
jgi:hypothetical protein